MEQFLRRAGCSHHVLTGLKRTDRGICLNGAKVYTNRTLCAGDVLSVHLEETESSPNILPSPVPFSIVYEDADILVVNKPADTPVHPSQGNYSNTLANGVAWYFMQQGIPYVFRCINRLDRDTTGLLLLAKHAVSGAVLSGQMMRRQIRRTYRALVFGTTPPSGTIDAPIGRKEGSSIERRIDPLGGERAVTHYRTLQHFFLTVPDVSGPTAAVRSNELPASPSGAPETAARLACSRIELRLETGRTHQIRVHMTGAGHPLLGDTLYHPSDPSGLTHQALHSYALEFLHPVGGQPMRFTVPEPWEVSDASDTSAAEIFQSRLP